MTEWISSYDWRMRIATSATAAVAVLLLLFGNEAAAVTVHIGNDIVTSESSITLPGNAFIIPHARVPEVAGNRTAVLLSITAHFVNNNAAVLQFWRRVPGQANDLYLELVHEYEFRSPHGAGVHTIPLYQDAQPPCILLQSDDIMGVFISEAPGAVSFATAEPQALRRYFDNVTQYPVEGSHVEFDPLFFPNAFNVRATLELGDDVNGTYEGVTCEDFDDIVARLLELTTQEQTTTTINLKGESGATGATGPRGPAGADGAAGAKGDAGAVGSTGATGAMGATGVRGDPGIGATGPEGQKGDRGEVGEVGATGSTGATGVTGPKGDRGEAGPAGVTGAPGVGSTGMRGEKGDRGDAGDAGDVGATGPVGGTGATGRAGADGLVGPPGPAGNFSLPPYTGKAQQQDDSELLEDYVIILLIVWNALLTLLVLSLYVRKCCSACRRRRNQNRVMSSESDFSDAQYQPDYDDQLVTPPPLPAARQHNRRQKTRVKPV